MVTFTDAGKRAGSFILSEASGKRSRENIVLAEGENLGAGAVVGKLTSGGKYVAYDNGASDGSQAARGILIYPTDATDADTPASIITRDAEVNLYQLDWGTETATSDMDAGIVDLAARGIICRERPEVDAS